MTSAATKLLQQALSLPEDDRRRLGEALLDSVPRDEAERLQQAWVDEAVRRAEQVERGEGESVDLEDALSELRTDLRRASQ